MKKMLLILAVILAAVWAQTLFSQEAQPEAPEIEEAAAAQPDTDAPMSPVVGWLIGVLMAGLPALVGYVKRTKYQRYINVLLSTLWEGAEAVTAGCLWYKTPNKATQSRLIKEAKDVVIVPKKLWQETKRKSKQ